MSNEEIPKRLRMTELGSLPDDWEVVRLGDVSLSFIGGGTPSTTNPDYWNGDIAWMTSAHIKERVITTGQKFITKEGLKNSTTNLIPKDNLLVATRVGIGKAAINKIDIAISQDLTGIIIDKNKSIPDFLYWCIINNERRLKSLAQGSTIKGILREELGRLKIPLPPLPEQQKIAEILSTVDKAIQKVDEAIAKIERLKKGLMQELLTKGIGHTEFKDTEIGRIPEEWGVVRIIDISKTYAGGTPSRRIKDYYNGSIPWVKSGEINQGFIYNTEEKITEEGLKNSNAKWIAENTVLVAMYGATAGKVGILKIKATTNQAVLAIPNTYNKFNPEFLYYMISSRTQKLVRTTQGTGQPNLSKELIDRIKIPLPPLPEQHKIAEILSTVDKKLELERKRKERLDRIKKGLMNDLLSGRRRRRRAKVS